MDLKKITTAFLMILLSVPVFAQGLEDKTFRWFKYNWGVTLLILFILICAIALIKIYNMLVKKQNEVDNAFSTIDVMLKKRYDLLPNLIEVVKQYAGHEKETLEKVTAMRAKAGAPGISDDERINIENQITQTMGRLMVTVESYPDLKANQNFLSLQTEWNEIEDEISATRRYFNATVTDYNNSVEMFPTNIVAKWMGYKEHTLFVIPETERANVSAKAVFNN